MPTTALHVLEPENDGAPKAQHIEPSATVYGAGQRIISLSAKPDAIKHTYGRAFKTRYAHALGSLHALPVQKQAVPRWADTLPVCIALGTVGLQLFWPDVLRTTGPVLFLLGMVFPGIPHGALDHCIALAGHGARGRLLGFIGSYLSIMALIGLLWLWSPILGVVLFLVYSAWHFGETDAGHWRAFHPLRAWLHGTSVLGFLLAMHPDEFATYLQALGVTSEVTFPDSLTQNVSVLSAAGLLVCGWGLAKPSIGSWGQTLLVVFLGAFLPLIPAFGIYFIGVHSVRGWFHLRYGLNTSPPALLRKAMPFSLGAYGLFFVLLALDRYAAMPFEGILPGVFVFLAALSAPHIWLMHRFYRLDKAAT